MPAFNVLPEVTDVPSNVTSYSVTYSNDDAIRSATQSIGGNYKRLLIFPV